MRTRPTLLLSLSLVISFFCLAYPIYVIRPFRYQAPRELAAALRLIQFRPAVEIACAALALFILVFAWRNATTRKKVVLAFLSVLVFACSFLSRINIYEKMFHPLGHPTFSAAAHSKLAAKEQVIAVLVNKTARAYPIRDISYHHMVNDTLAGRSIVATY